ncbi:MAG: cellulase family glycosylhydrolase, partial [Balneolales bacterium]
MKKLYKITYFLILAMFLLPELTYSQHNRIDVDGNDLFLSGTNVAWVSFAHDIGPGTTSLSAFEDMFQALNANGGNTMRLWLHVDGSNTPEWDGMDVIGPGVGAIDDLRDILDLAHNYDVSLMLCLWSFDMLSQNSSQPHIPQRARGILTDQNKTDLYIQNALIPMVDALEGHPAIGSWEIFNEPEGMSEEFGWSAQQPHVPMTDIQRFINKAAAAIKNTDPDALVTNGAWSFTALSDNVGGSNAKNYYSDAELIAQGGEQNGTLDFYSVHYYPIHFGTAYSPFHHDASYWGLDKPIVVGEFYNQDSHGVPYQDLYTTLYDRGYAGALSWQYANRNSSGCQSDGYCYNLDWPRTIDRMNELQNLYPNAVNLDYNGQGEEEVNDDFDGSLDDADALGSWLTSGSSMAKTTNETDFVEGTGSVELDYSLVVDTQATPWGAAIDISTEFAITDLSGYDSLGLDYKVLEQADPSDMARFVVKIGTESGNLESETTLDLSDDSANWQTAFFPFDNFTGTGNLAEVTGITLQIVSGSENNGNTIEGIILFDNLAAYPVEEEEEEEEQIGDFDGSLDDADALGSWLTSGSSMAKTTNETDFVEGTGSVELDYSLVVDTQATPWGAAIDISTEFAITDLSGYDSLGLDYKVLEQADPSGMARFVVKIGTESGNMQSETTLDLSDGSANWQTAFFPFDNFTGTGNLAEVTGITLQIVSGSENNGNTIEGIILFDNLAAYPVEEEEEEEE